MLFHSWSALGRVVVVTVVVFALVVVLLRIVGQQALAKMSGYDVVVTVTLGSILASAMVTRSVTVSEAATALVTLIALQETVRWFQSRWLPAHHAVRESPRVVLWEGQLLEDRLEAIHVSADEVRAAVRQAGFSSLGQVRVVILENDGDWSVIPSGQEETDDTALFGLPIPGRNDRSPTGTRYPRPSPPDRLP
jgi:uncharacterized membrane protein YcaP (DUF421 family)